MITDDLHSTLNNALQCNVSFVLNKKTLREGKLLLFTIKDFYITFVLITKKDLHKTYELPVPFEFKHIKDTIIFDYSVQNICKKHQKISELIGSLHKQIGKKSKLFDNILTIHLHRDSTK